MERSNYLESMDRKCLLPILLFLFIIIQGANGKIIDDLQIRYFPGVLRFTSQTYGGSGLNGLGTGYSNRIAANVIFFSGGYKFYSGLQYESGNVGARIILKDTKYNHDWASSYSSMSIGIPIGFKMKLNKNERKYSYLTAELFLGLYSQESYSFSSASISFTPPYTYEYHSEDLSSSYNSVSKIMFTFGIEKQLPLSKKFNFITGIDFSIPGKVINADTGLKLVSSSLNLIIGIGYR